MENNGNNNNNNHNNNHDNNHDNNEFNPSNSKRKRNNFWANNKSGYHYYNHRTNQNQQYNYNKRYRENKFRHQNSLNNYNSNFLPYSNFGKNNFTGYHAPNTTIQNFYPPVLEFTGSFFRNQANELLPHPQSPPQLLSDVISTEEDKSEVILKNKKDEGENKTQDNSKISLVPLSNLIKPEHQKLLQKEQDNNIKHNAAEKISSPSSPVKPNITQTIDPNKISKKYINQIMDMDLSNIKYVINTQNPKFDTILKANARNNKRKEIRKQLQTMNSSNNICAANNEIDRLNENFIQPDEIVDSSQISESLYGLIGNWLETGNVHDENYLVDIDETTLLSTVGLETTNLPQISKQQNIDFEFNETDKNIESNTKNLKTNPENDNYSKTDKSAKDLTTPSNIVESNEIVTINSSSSSSESNNSSSDSDSNSDSNNSVNSLSSVKKAKIKKILEGNVITHFNTLILPIITNKERQKFQKNKFKNDTEILMYILDYCFKNSHAKITLTNSRKRILKKNLKSKNNEEALQFLMEQIKEMFETNKSKRKELNSKEHLDTIKHNENTVPTDKRRKDSKPKIKEKNISLGKNVIKSNKNSPHTVSPYYYTNKLQTTSQIVEKNLQVVSKKNAMNTSSLSQNAVTAKLSLIADTTFNNQSINDINCSTSASDSNPITTSNKNKNLINKSNSSPDKNTLKNRKGINNDSTEKQVISTENEKEITLLVDANNEVRYEEDNGKKIIHLNSDDDADIDDNNRRVAIINVEREFNCKTNKITTDAENSVCLETTKYIEKNKKENGSYINNKANKVNVLSECVTHSDGRIECDEDSRLEYETNEALKTQRLWKSPGEKKCLQISDIQKVQTDHTSNNSQNTNNQKETQSTNSVSTNEIISNNFSNLLISLSNNNQTDMINRLNSFDQNKISEVFMKNIKDIDLKLMNIHVRKNDIQEMMLLLQKEKYSINLKTVQLQREKYLLDLETLQLQNEKFIVANATLLNDNNSSVTPNASSFNIKFEPTSIPNIEQMNSQELKTAIERKRKLVQNNLEMQSEEGSTKQKCHQSQKISSSIHHKSLNEENSNPSPQNSDYNGEFSNESYHSENLTNGPFEHIKFPVTQIKIVKNFVIAGSEDGSIYKFCLNTKKIISKFIKHTEAVTAIFFENNNFIYSISLDGFLKKNSVEDFEFELLSINLHEPLQCIDLQWNLAFIGSRWGNVFTYNTKNNKLSETLLCSVGSCIIALKATKEGARNILIISSKSNEINFRDATSGLLLRTLCIPNNLNICNILLDDNLIYCGSNKNEIYTFNFTTLAKGGTFMCGNGIVSMKLYNKKLILVGCYDGFVYALDKKTGSQIGRFPGAGKMILALDTFEDKFITSSKDNVMEIKDIPKYILAL